MSVADYVRRVLQGGEPAADDAVADAGPPLTHAEATIEAALRERFSRDDYTPPVMPSVALELLALMDEPTTEIATVLATLERDPLLASQVMRLAQSPAFATKVPARSLNDAARRLGFRRLTGLAWAAALDTQVFRSPAYGEAMEALRAHSLAVATLGRAVGQRARVEPDHVFLCGLLHEVGAAAALLVLGELPDAERPPLDSVWGALRDVHEPISGLVASLWGLGERLEDVIGNHHDAPATPVDACLVLAEWLAVESGAAPPFRPAPPFCPAPHVPSVRRSIEWLRLDNAALAALRAQAQEIAGAAAA
ncbi:MAG: HDOD domain-containing protein [Myxococcota bacterium]